MGGNFSAVGECIVSRLPNYGYEPEQIDYKEFSGAQRAVVSTYTTGWGKRTFIYSIDLHQAGDQVRAAITLADVANSKYGEDAKHVTESCGGSA